ncbi:hypothetical protein D9M68_951180 [compost metagenome]
MDTVASQSRQLGCNPRVDAFETLNRVAERAVEVAHQKTQSRGLQVLDVGPSVLDEHLWRVTGDLFSQHGRSGG